MVSAAAPIKRLLRPLAAFGLECDTMNELDENNIT